jgi:hypothetical protein
MSELTLPPWAGKGKYNLCVFTAKPYIAPFPLFPSASSCSPVSTTKTSKITMDPAKLAKLQAQAASNRIGELFSPSKSTESANKKTHFATCPPYSVIFAIKAGRELCVAKSCGKPNLQQHKTTKDFKEL